MKKLPLLIIVLTSALALPLAVRAEDPKPGKGQGQGRGQANPEERLKMMTEKLSLTQEQQDKIKPILEKGATQMKEIMAKGRDNATEEDKAKFRELMKSQGEEIGAILTPEQKEKWKESRGPGGPGGKKPDANK